MRQLKKPEIRRGEIVDTALRLFADRGYEKTTVEAIIGELGVAKGCFYHYFRSKEDLFGACAEIVSERLLADYRGILENPAARPAERLVAFLDYTYGLADDPDGFLRSPQPTAVADLDHRVSNTVAAQLLPSVTSLVDEGDTVGDFVVTDPEMTAVAVLGALNNLHNAYVFRAGLDLAAHRRGVLQLLDRMLVAQLPESVDMPATKGETR